MITDQEFMLYFLNEHAKFIFTLREDFIYKENNSLIFLINQPISEVSMYRNYSVNYIFRDTKINTNASDHLVNITLTSENKDVVYISNYYIYLLLINVCTSTNLDDDLSRTHHRLQLLGFYFDSLYNSHALPPT